MYCTRDINDHLISVGGNDRRLAMFEGVYSVPAGVSYNSYLLLDESTVLFDTVDKAVGKVFFENIEHALSGRSLDYLIVQHMEPDHSATLLELVRRYPGVTVVCSAMSKAMIGQFFHDEINIRTVKEGDTLTTGAHTLHFIMAPMIHWPEVMMTYDDVDHALYSADAFGCFGATNGALFADEVDFDRDYMDEARRYYCNIVGKYGAQVQALLKKAEPLDIQLICPLHGFVWRRELSHYIEKYRLWSAYEPEEKGVVIAYASVYGNTENAAELLAVRLCEAGVRVVMYDTSVTPASEIIAAAFRYSHLVFASTTYNAGIFIAMEELLRDIAAHNLSNRTVALIQNGSWAPTSRDLMKDILSKCKGMTFLDEGLTIKSSLAPEQLCDIDALSTAIADSVKGKASAPEAQPEGKRWVCGICGYVYDEAKEGVPFESLPDDWRCPLCRQPKSVFKLQ